MTWTPLSPTLADLAPALTAGWRQLLTVAWPVTCASCRAPDVVACALCLAALHTGSRHMAVRAWPDGPGVWAAATYRGRAARLVVAWKDRDRFDLTRRFGAALADPLTAAADAAGGEPLLLVPIPTSRANRRRRGSDLVLDLAGAAARSAMTGGAWPGAPPRVAPALCHVRRVRDQSELGADARRVNVHGALSVTRRWARRVNGRPVLLVDDIVTTGATMAEAARALSAAGAEPVGACCLCVTIRQQGVFVGAPLV